MLLPERLPALPAQSLPNMVNEAALRAVRENRKFVTQADLEESIETVIAGYQKKNRVLSNKEKLIVSYHEIGHALVAALQTNSAPVTKSLSSRELPALSAILCRWRKMRKI